MITSNDHNVNIICSTKILCYLMHILDNIKEKNPCETNFLLK